MKELQKTRKQLKIAVIGFSNFRAERAGFSREIILKKLGLLLISRIKLTLMRFIGIRAGLKKRGLYGKIPKPICNKYMLLDFVLL
ncbi:MAG: hypothetical protein PVH88_18830 [Ignavibacteria bacterium]|jgi:hypothetical protein